MAILTAPETKFCRRRAPDGTSRFVSKGVRRSRSLSHAEWTRYSSAAHLASTVWMRKQDLGPGRLSPLVLGECLPLYTRGARSWADAGAIVGLRLRLTGSVVTKPVRSLVTWTSVELLDRAA
jgi:hypothetical protein